MYEYYPGEPVNTHLQLLINIMQEINWVITTKRVRINCRHFLVIENGSFPSMVGNSRSPAHFNICLPRLHTIIYNIPNQA